MRYETDDEIAVIDPFLPRDGSFDPHEKPVGVLLTQPAHYGRELATSSMPYIELKAMQREA